MGRRRSDQSAMSPAFNPHPSVRRGAIVRHGIPILIFCRLSILTPP